METYNIVSNQYNTITFYNNADGKQVEMLRLTPEGFYVRGVKLESVGQQEAREVYDAFCAFVCSIAR